MSAGMDFSLNDDQKMIAEAAESFMAEACPSSSVREAMESPTGYDAALWKQIAEDMGWCATHIPESQGGLGLSWVELTLIFEQMGRRLLPSPFFATVGLAATTLLEAVDEATRAPYLEKIAVGQLRATVALAGKGLSWCAESPGATAQACAEGYRLQGRFRHVPDGASAELLLLPARLENGELALFAVAADLQGIERKEHVGVDLTRRVAEVVLTDVTVGKACKLAAGPQLDDRLQRVQALATLVLAAEQLGGAQQCLDLTLAYAAERVQFGRPINAFQAVKHRCAEMMVKIEATRSAVGGCARVAATVPGTAELLREAACVKSFASETFYFCAQEAIQLHGGVGFTWEYDPQLYFKRAQASAHWFGDVDASREAIASWLITGGEAEREKPEEADEALAFRAEISQWMGEHLTGRFACLKHRGGAGDEDAYPELRKEWEQELAKGGWTCVGWPKEYGGRGLSVAQQIIFHEEYARAGGPGNIGHLGETLLGPTVIAYGSEAQKQQFLPGIVAGTEYWCQGYSEPSAGSDLANVQTRARLDPVTGEWVLHGQKVWTSLAHESQWIFVVARCEPESRGHHGLIFLLVKLDQPGVDVRGIKQITGTCEFNEVFFDGARCPAQNVIGQPGEGWKIAMALLGFERGLSWIGMQMHFAHQLELVCKAARDTGSVDNPLIRARIGQAWMGLKVMHYNTLRTLSGGDDGSLSREGYIIKYYWSNWHRDLGKLAMDALGVEGDICVDDFSRTRLQQVFLFSRSDTIVAGTNEIQLNIIAERALGMPKEARPTR